MRKCPYPLFWRMSSWLFHMTSFPMRFSVGRDCGTLTNIAPLVPVQFYVCVCACLCVYVCVSESEREGGQSWKRLHKEVHWSVKENRWLHFLPSSFMCHLPYCAYVCVSVCVSLRSYCLGSGDLCMSTHPYMHMLNCCLWVCACVCVCALVFSLVSRVPVGLETIRTSCRSSESWFSKCHPINNPYCKQQCWFSLLLTSAPFVWLFLCLSHTL